MERTDKKKSAGKLVAIWALATVLVIGGTVGGTLAWLLDSSETVTNTFTASGIDIELKEGVDTDNNGTESFKMVPGWEIVKDPMVTVKANSEDCWLFVKITESTDPALSDYISYDVKLDDPATTVVEDWTQGDGSNIPVNVYYRKVAKSTSDQTFNIIGYTKDDGTFVENKVLVNDTVTSDLMKAIDGVSDKGVAKDEEQPTLTLQAYAVQLKKTADGTVEFTAVDAWEEVD